jgi:hypothetical protein
MNDYKNLKYILDKVRFEWVFWKIEHTGDIMFARPMISDKPGISNSYAFDRVYDETDFDRWKNNSGLVLIYSEKEYLALKIKYSDKMFN